MLVTTVGFLDIDTVGMLRAAETPVPHLRRIVLLEGSESAGEALPGADVEPWQAFASRAEGVTAAAATERRQSVRPTDTSDVLFTSGTTGRPKGVVMTHGQTVRQFREWCEFAGLRPGDRYLIVNPFFHMFGYKAGWLASLLQGATIVPVPVFDVPTVLSLVETERITVLPGAPTIYRSILDHPERDRFDLHTLRVAVTGAADIPVSLIEEMRAEFSVPHDPHRLRPHRGRARARAPGPTTTRRRSPRRPGGRCRVSKSSSPMRTEQEVERGTPGELLVRGYSVMQGYLDDPEATAAAIDGRGFLHTGDLATMDDRGYVRIVGRLKDMLIVGGFNVYPAEVENALLAHDAIAPGRRRRRARPAPGRGRHGVRRSRLGTARSIPPPSSPGLANGSPTTRCRATSSRSRRCRPTPRARS